VEEGMAKIKGIALVASRDYLIKKFGINRVKKAVSTLSKEYQKYILKPIATEWYPEDVIVESFRTIQREFKIHSKVEVEETIKEGTLFLINRYLRKFIKIDDPEHYICLIPATWSFLHDTGDVQILEKSSNRVKLKYIDFPYINDPLYKRVILGTLLSALKASGAVKVNIINIREGDNELEVEISWQYGIKAKK